MKDEYYSQFYEPYAHYDVPIFSRRRSRRPHRPNVS
jgi:hypothetical protein